MEIGRIRSRVGAIGGCPAAVTEYRYGSKRVVRCARPGAHPLAITESIAPWSGVTPSIDRNGGRPLRYSAATRDLNKWGENGGERGDTGTRLGQMTERALMAVGMVPPPGNNT